MDKGKWIVGEVENEYSYINFVIQLSRESAASPLPSYILFPLSLSFHVVLWSSSHGYGLVE